MNCANHPDRERAAFCQNCGKPLCSECTRGIGNSIFCEPCFTARTTAPGQPPAGQPPYTAGPFQPGAYNTGAPNPGAPSPGLAALLGFIPGVGAMYNGQYAKGFVHLIIFAILTSLADNGNDIFGLFVAGWVIYMVIEAHHTARARRDGTPLPNPFGLNDLGERLGFGKAWPSSAPYTANPNPNPNAPGQTPDPNTANPNAPPYSYTYNYVPPVSSWGAPQDYSYGAPPIPPIPPVPPVPPMPPYADPNSNLPYQRRVPTGAIWLIGLGVFFLLANSGIFHLRGRFFGPFLLIAVGVWVFVRKMTGTGQGLEDDGTQNYRWRLAHAVNGSFWIVLVGIIWLIDAVHILSWAHSWPLYLIGVGLLMLFKRTMYAGYGAGPGGVYPTPPNYPQNPPPTPPVTTTDLVPTHDHSPSDDSNREGR
jgi:hypothetical protein